MAATYLDMITKLQEQGLDALKKAQAAHIDALGQVREYVEKLPMPAMPAMPAMPGIEGLPTMAQLTELQTTFVENIVEQQKAYAKQLAEVFAPLKKNAN